MKGFFSSQELYKHARKQRQSTVAKCGECKLYKSCMSPKMDVGGNGKQKILLVAEGPGGIEDKRNDQLVGNVGSYLNRKTKRKFDIDIHEDCWKINSVNCRPPNNRTPTNKEINACRPKVMKAIQDYQPHIIIPLGTPAIHSLLGDRWKKDLGSITKWRGWTIPDKDLKAWVCPTFHPSYVNRETTPEVAELIFEQDLERAFNLINAPLPDFVYESEEDKIEIIRRKDDIETYLQKLLLQGPPVTAFDYETTGLKPDKDVHEILTCSISEGPNHAVAFPMVEGIMPTFKDYLRSNYIWKIAANMGYEINWSREMLDCEVNNLLMDCCLGAHIEDNRRKITSVKFQTYVRYGVCDYDSHLDEYKKSKTGYDRNRFKELPLRDILTYNGLDSMFEYRIGMELCHSLGIEVPEDQAPV